MTTSAQIEELKTLVEPGKVLTDADSLDTYGKDWTKHFAPAPCAIVFPKTIEQVQAIVRWANAHKVALVPSGGRTGLSAAAVAANGEVVVSFDYMNQILEFNEMDRTAVCQPGVVTAQLQQFAEDKGLYYPVDFASAGSSQIGGNIGTNAGGIKVIRYGMTRNWVAGMKVVTGTGELLELNRDLIKNATGYDLRQLFIGAEGTLGVVTAATLKLFPIMRSRAVAVVGLETAAASVELLARAKAETGGGVEAFELMKRLGMELVLKNIPDTREPLESTPPWYVLIEIASGTPGGADDPESFGGQRARGRGADSGAGAGDHRDAHGAFFS